MDPPARPLATEVGDAFTEQYYFLLEEHPTELHRVYKDFSKIGRPGKDGKMCSCTLSNINENLNMLSSGGFNSAVVTSVISQNSLNESVFVDVRGYFTLNERLKRNFTQVFFLAPQEKGYFVLNDMLTLDDKPIPLGNNVVEEKVPETEVPRIGSLRVSEPNEGLEDGSKIADASVVMEAIPKGQGQDSSCDPSQALTKCSIVHLRNLPPSYTTIASVENALKKFGAIKRGGIEITNPGGNYYYGTVEFEEAKAAKRAIKASPLRLDRRKVKVQKKRTACKSYMEQMTTIHEEEGRQHNQNKYGSDQVRGTGVFIPLQEKGTEYSFWDWQRSMEKQSKLREEAGETGVEHFWDYEQVMEEYRKFQEEEEEENQN